MNKKLYVGNLSYGTNEAALRELFSKAGAIASIAIPLDRVTNTPRGFAFVEMETSAEALKAIQLCNGQEVDGRAIRVNEAKPLEARNDNTDRGPRRNQNRW